MLNEKNDFSRDLFEFSNIFKKFLIESFEHKKIYIKKKHIIRVPVNIDHLWTFNPFLVKKIVKEPLVYCKLAEYLLNQMFQPFHDKKDIISTLKLNLHGSFGNTRASSLTIRCKFLGQLVSFKGVIVDFSEKNVGIEKSVYYCKNSDKLYVKDFSEKRFNQRFSDLKYENLELEQGLSDFYDWQKITIQDIHEGWISDIFPGTVDVILENDLVEDFELGQEVEIIGILYPGYEKKKINACIFSPTIYAMSFNRNMKKINKIYHKLDFTFFENFSKLLNSFDILTSFVMPEIPDQIVFKKGVLFFLASGSINGLDAWKSGINILLVGNSLSLNRKYLDYISDFFFSRVVKSGELKLAFSKIFDNRNKSKIRFLDQNISYFNSHIVCLDEYDNFTNTEKRILEEILSTTWKIEGSSQTKKHFSLLKKIVLSTSLNSIYYDKPKSFEKNIKMPENILNNFDLIFMFEESFSIEDEKKKVKKMLENYFYNLSKHKSSEKLNGQSLDHYSKNYRQDKKIVSKISNFIEDKTSLKFLRVFINYCKTNFNPRLTEQAEIKIINDYLKLKSDKNKIIKINIKKLETLICVSIAYTRLHFRKKTTFSDANYANDYLLELLVKKKENSNDSLASEFSNKAFDKKFYSIKEKREKSWKINIKKKRFPNLFRKMTTNQIKFFSIKRLNLIDLKNSDFEKFIYEWIDKGICILMKKFILKI